MCTWDGIACTMQCWQPLPCLLGNILFLMSRAVWWCVDMCVIHSSLGVYALSAILIQSFIRGGWSWRHMSHGFGMQIECVIASWPMALYMAHGLVALCRTITMHCLCMHHEISLGQCSHFYQILRIAWKHIYFATVWSNSIIPNNTQHANNNTNEVLLG